MKGRYALSLVLAAHAVACAVFWGVLPGESSTTAIEQGRVALATAQVSLVAIWAAMGSSKLAFRAVALIAITSLWSWHYNLAGPLGEFSKTMTHIALPLVAYVVAPLLLGRLGGWVVRQVEAAPAATTDEPPHVPQFSLRRMLLGVTVVSLFLALERLFGYFADIFLSDFQISVFLMSFAAVALMALWAVLGEGRLPLRLAVFAVVAIGIEPTLVLFDNSPQIQNAEAMRLSAALGLIVAATLLVFRYDGYRLTRRRPGVSAPVPGLAPKRDRGAASGTAG